MPWYLKGEHRMAVKWVIKSFYLYAVYHLCHSRQLMIIAWSHHMCIKGFKGDSSVRWHNQMMTRYLWEMERSHCLSFVTMEINTVLTERGRCCCIVLMKCCCGSMETVPFKIKSTLIKHQRISDWQSGFQSNFSPSGSSICLTWDISSDSIIITMLIFQLCVRPNEIFDLSCPNLWVKSVWALTKASSSMYTAGLLAVTKYCTFLMLQPRTYIRSPHTAAVDLPTPALQWT